VSGRPAADHDHTRRKGARFTESPAALASRQNALFVCPAPLNGDRRNGAPCSYALTPAKCHPPFGVRDSKRSLPRFNLTKLCHAGPASRTKNLMPRSTFGTVHPPFSSTTAQTKFNYSEIPPHNLLQPPKAQIVETAVGRSTSPIGPCLREPWEETTGAPSMVIRAHRPL